MLTHQIGNCLQPCMIHQCNTSHHRVGMDSKKPHNNTLGILTMDILIRVLGSDAITNSNIRANWDSIPKLFIVIRRELSKESLLSRSTRTNAKPVIIFASTFNVENATQISKGCIDTFERITVENHFFVRYVRYDSNINVNSLYIYDQCISRKNMNQMNQKGNDRESGQKMVHDFPKIINVLSVCFASRVPLLWEVTLQGLIEDNGIFIVSINAKTVIAHLWGQTIWNLTSGITTMDIRITVPGANVSKNSNINRNWPNINAVRWNVMRRKYNPMGQHRVAESASGKLLLITDCNRAW